MVASLGGCCVLAVSSFFMHFADTEQLTAFDHLVQFLKEQNTFPNRPRSANRTNFYFAAITTCNKAVGCS